MSRNLWGLLLSFAYVFLVIGLSGWVSKRRKGSPEVSRKVVHILVGNWVFLLPMFTDLWAALFVPISFIVINFLSVRFHLFKSMEREERSYGTVYYAISLTVLVAIAFTMKWPILAYAGVLIMAYGDGFAAIVGEQYGKNHPFSFSPEKSLEGALTVFLFATVISLGCLLYFKSDLPLLGIIALSIATGAVATLIEIGGKAGCDNLTLPLGSGLFLTLSVYFGDVYYYLYLFVVAVILYVAIQKNNLTYQGVIAAFMTAITLYTLGNAYLGYALLVFFVLGSFFSKIKNKGKKKLEQSMETTSKRTWIQVLANSLPAILLTWMYLYHPNEKGYLLLAFAVMSAAAADTFSSEIGSLTNARVVSILTWKTVPKGLSGGVSLPGIVAGIAGSLILSAFAVPSFGWRGFFIVSALGVAGSFIDSYLGILFQRKYKNEQGILQDKPVHAGQNPEAGLAFVSNNTVNVTSLFLVAVIGYLLVL